MGGKLHLVFIILCVYLFQEIGAQSNKRTDLRVKIEDAPFVVKVLELDERFCAANILSSTVVITASACISNETFLKGDYAVYSGSTSMDPIGTRHKVVKIVRQREGKAALNTNSLALLEVKPPIDLVKSPNRAITLHPIATLAKNTVAKFIGWGCIHQKQKEDSEQLQREDVIILDRPTCLKNVAGEDAPLVSSTTVCASVSREDIGKCRGDIGAPLIVKDQLIAVMSWPPKLVRHYNVFVYINLAERENYEWVMKNKKIIEESASKNKKQ